MSDKTSPRERGQDPESAAFSQPTPGESFDSLRMRIGWAIANAAFAKAYLDDVIDGLVKLVEHVDREAAE